MDEDKKEITGESKTVSAGEKQDTQMGLEEIERIVSERAAKAAEKIMQDTLKKQGFDSDAINKMTEEWKSKQTTPEDTIKKLQEELAAEQEKVNTLQQEKILRNHGLTDEEDIEVYAIRINRLLTDGKSFEEVAKEYFEKHPRNQKVPATATFGGSGKTPLVGAPTKEEYKKMSYLERLKLKKENPTAYENLKG